MAQTIWKSEKIIAPAEALLDQTLEECDHCVDRLRELLPLIDALIAVLPPERRVAYLEFASTFRSLARAIRNDPINDNIIAFAKGKEEVKSSEFRDALISKGLAVDQKRLANSLDYLSRKGQLERIGRGRYRDPATGAGYVGDATGEGYE